MVKRLQNGTKFSKKSPFNFFSRFQQHNVENRKIVEKSVQTCKLCEFYTFWICWLNFMGPCWKEVR